MGHQIHKLQSLALTNPTYAYVLDSKSQTGQAMALCNHSDVCHVSAGGTIIHLLHEERKEGCGRKLPETVADTYSNF